MVQSYRTMLWSIRRMAQRKTGGIRQNATGAR